MKENIYSSIIKRWFLLSIPFIFLLGSLFHYVFELSGSNIYLAPFFPVNESIFEHLKLTFYPILLWQLIGCLFLKNKIKLIFKNWVISIAISIIISTFLTVSLYYIAVGAFNIHSTIADISFYFISILFGQGLGLHLYNKCKDNRTLFLLSITLIILMFILFTLFTFLPPKLPLFLDSSTGHYGI